MKIKEEGVMNSSKVDEIALSFDHVSMDFKVEWDAFRFLLNDKMIAYKGHNKEGTPIVTLKLTPQENAWYRENHEYICEGYYMNKVHWISISYEEASLELMQELLEKAYNYGMSLLPKKIKVLWQVEEL